MNTPLSTATLLALVALASSCGHEPPPAADPPRAPGPIDVRSDPPLADAPPPDAGVADDGAAGAPTAPPAVAPPDMSAAPAYPASALYEAFSTPAARAKLIACYLPGKQRDPKLRGKVIVKFTINPDGGARPVANEGSNLTDDVVVACVVRTVKTLHFQKPLEGSVTVVYPFIFRPTGDETLILPDAGKK